MILLSFFGPRIMAYGTPNRTKALVEDGGGLGEDGRGLSEDGGDSVRRVGFQRGGWVGWRGG